MWLFLSKLLPIFVLPLGIWFCCTFTGLLLAKVRPRLAKGLIVCGFAVLTFFSLPIVSDSLVLSLETRYDMVLIQDAPKSDVIVLLGGGVALEDSYRARSELSYTGDRLLLAFQLYQAKKASVIWIASETSPHIPKTDTPISTESILQSWGVPSEALLGENNSRNTYENAAMYKLAAEKYDWQSSLLVTSANHLPRAMQQFEHQGISPVPMRSNHRVSKKNTSGIKRWLPQARSLDNSTRVLREYLGMLVYHVVGSRKNP